MLVPKSIAPTALNDCAYSAHNCGGGIVLSLIICLITIQGGYRKTACQIWSISTKNVPVIREQKSKQAHRFTF